MWNDNERWQMHDQDSGAGWVMVVLMLVVAIAVVAAVVVYLRRMTPGTAPSHAAIGRTPDPRSILQERFARGEIDEPEFRARTRALDETRP